MKIATWNVERLKVKSRLESINKMLDEINADILVVTETDSRIKPTNFKNRIDTPKLTELNNEYYAETENRVSIFTKYEVVRQFETYDKYTTLCVELDTGSGKLIIYGTIIGIYGNKRREFEIGKSNFEINLLKQILDVKKISEQGNICFIGDYNISFADNYYFTNFGRAQLNNLFEQSNIDLLTKQRAECIDHVAISKEFMKSKEYEIIEWNELKNLSDHKGICVNFTNQ